MKTHRRPIGAIVVSLALAGPSALAAAESGTSHFLPGLAGDLGFALPPAPGWSVQNVVWSQRAELDAAVLGRSEGEDLDLDIVLDIVAATYTTDKRVLGGTYSVGAMVPFGRATLDGEVAGEPFSAEATGLGDITLVPLQLNWSRGDFHFEVLQSVIVPTGAYDADDLVNIGRNHWSFDTVGAVTWLDPDRGTEVSVALGLMHNAENTATEYNTGNETHLDWAVNQRLADGFSVGLRGYRLNQLKGDSGEGASLGPLEGFSQGWGAGFVWTPAAGEGRLSVAGKVMRDRDVRDGRFESDFAQISLSMTF